MTKKKLPDDPRFKHVNYHHTDVAKTFARIRKERQAQEEAEKKPDVPTVVVPIIKRRR